MAFTLLLLALALGVGVAIGTVGVGGVLLAPLLAYVGGFELHRAMATSMWSFVFVGAAGALLYARRGSVSWRMVTPMAVGVVPGAVLGALANGFVRTPVLTVLLALVCIGSGLSTLRRPALRDRGAVHLGPPVLVGLGSLAGFGSSLTGTSGPVLLVPLLLAARTPALAAIGVSQALQVPIALFGTLGYVPSGQIELPLGALLGLAEVAGAVWGVRLAHAARPAVLRQLVALAVVLAGLFMLVRLAAGG